MNFMKNFSLFSFGLLMLIGCKKDKMNKLEDCIDIGEYFLLTESLEVMPYLNKKKAQFVDTLGNYIELEINERPLNDIMDSELTIYDYNVHVQGDTVRYKFRNQSKTYSLVNDTLNLYFILTLEAFPSTNMTVSDILGISILNTNPNSNALSFPLGTLVVNQRSRPEIMPSLLPREYDEINFYGKKFNKVFEIIDRVDVYFNYEFGIVVFSDYEDKLWRFEKFID